MDSKKFYVPGLDGLRALSVIAVLLYHSGLLWFGGGFLGVEVFFVISGYLITWLLLEEWQQQGTIELKAFWLRRARRLLPAVLLLIMIVLAYAVLFLPEEVAGLRKDALASVVYVTNWYLILDHKSYFEAVSRPSLLRHLWSLAVEEQFYLLWPVILTLSLRFLRFRGTILLTLVGAVVSTAAMSTMFNPEVDPSRIYYGTDTRAAGLLFGALVAFAWSPRRLPVMAGHIPSWLVNGIGLGSLAALVFFFISLAEFDPFLYQGGFASVAIITSMLIAVTAHPRAGVMHFVLGLRPLRWVGVRSYSIYLWHWPIFMITRPYVDVPIGGFPLLVAQFGATCLLAEASYRFIETPFRHGLFGRIMADMNECRRKRTLHLGLRGGAASLSVAGAVVIAVAVACAQPPAPPSYLTAESIDTVGHSGVVLAQSNGTPDTRPSVSPSPQTNSAVVVQSASVTPSALPVPTAKISPVATDAGRPVSPVPSPANSPVSPLPAASPTGNTGNISLLPTRTAQPVASPLSLPPTPPPAPTGAVTGAPETATPSRVVAIGDSVMLGAAEELQKQIPTIEVDATVSRQVSTTIDLLHQLDKAKQLGSTMVLHVGNNGTFTARQFDEIMSILGPDRKTIMLNLRVPRSWEALNNQVLKEGAERHPNVKIIDWHSASFNRIDLFWQDGIHLRPEGAQLYAKLVAAEVAGH